MNILITLCARGGSKGIPGKNIKMLNAIPLIAYSIQTALDFAKTQENVFLELSTDSDEIKGVAKKFGLDSNYSRPDYLAGDKVGKIDAINDILQFAENERGVQFEYVLDLDVTSPLRTVDDLKKGLELIQNDEGALNLFSVNPASRSPYFNMVEKNETGYYSLIKELPSRVLTRQSAPKVYDLNASFYFYKRKFFTKDNKSAITDATLIYEMPHLCFDLDEPIDFEFLSYLLESDKLDFEL